MKQPIEKRNASGIVDYIALVLTTVGVGYIPGAPGTYGSAVAVAIYLGVRWYETPASPSGMGAGFNMGLVWFLVYASHTALNALLLTAFCLVGIWASGRTAPIFGRKDPSQAVVDEVMGQLITFCFVPFGVGWAFIFVWF